MRNDSIKLHIRQYYAALYENKQPRHLPVKTGRLLAECLNYPLTLLHFLSDNYWQHFLPCGNPMGLLSPKSGDRLLNLGCGAAIDSFVMAALHKDGIEIVNLDVVFTALHKACCQARRAPFEHMLRWLCADGEKLPFQNESFDWLLMNGSFNLFPEKSTVLQEIRRVLKPLGVFCCADLCAASMLPDYFEQEKDAWAWCMSGACTEERLGQLLTSHALECMRLNRRKASGDLLYPVVFSCRKV